MVSGAQSSPVLLFMLLFAFNVGEEVLLSIGSVTIITVEGQHRPRLPAVSWYHYVCTLLFSTVMNHVGAHGACRAALVVTLSFSSIPFMPILLPDWESHSLRLPTREEEHIQRLRIFAHPHQCPRRRLRSIQLAMSLEMQGGGRSETPAATAPRLHPSIYRFCHLHYHCHCALA